MAKRLFRSAPKFWGTDSEAIRKVVLQVVGDLQRGKANNTYDVTLGVSVTTTTLTDTVCTADSVALLSPRTATAAAAVGSVTGVQAVCADGGTVTLTHDISIATDRTFGVAILG